MSRLNHAATGAPVSRAGAGGFGGGIGATAAAAPGGFGGGFGAAPAAASQPAFGQPAASSAAGGFGGFGAAPPQSQPAFGAAAPANDARGEARVRLALPVEVRETHAAPLVHVLVQAPQRQHREGDEEDVLEARRRWVSRFIGVAR